MTPASPDLWTVVTVLVVSAVSGAVSITRRIAAGTAVTLVWVMSEFMAAILCGWLAFDSYHVAKDFLPDWVTMQVFVAVAAHTGGRLLQSAEAILQTGITVRRRK